MSSRQTNRRKGDYRGIRNLQELREARMILNVERRHLETDLVRGVENSFSMRNFISMLIPQGSPAALLSDGFTDSIAVVKGIVRGIQLFRSRRRH